jgi:hypothetical protein
MDSRSTGFGLAAVGVAVIVIGLSVALGLLGWFGRLPGDIRIEGANVQVYVPLASMLVVSLVLSGLLAILRRLL